MARMRQQGGIWAGDKIGKDEGRREEKEGEEAVAAILEVRMRCMMSINHPSRALVGSIRDGACPKERKENDFYNRNFLVISLKYKGISQMLQQFGGKEPNDRPEGWS
jgi:hypothetical protein